MDTWHILEQRFHDIGNRDHNVVLEFHEKDSEEYWYQLAGPRPEGEWIGVLIGRSMDGSVPKRDFSTGHYSVTDLGETLRRAGHLLNVHEKRDCYDPIGMAGSRRFVALLVKQFGKLAHEDTPAGRVVRFFANGARACGMMAGRLASPEPSGNDSDVQVNTTATLSHFTEAVLHIRDAGGKPTKNATFLYVHDTLERTFGSDLGLKLWQQAKANAAQSAVRDERTAD